ncbi:MAG: hypothetical protein KDA24_14025 [Deltaproteobacteria bacterium]|nr:hypothetical protein [Deltaproteobacteria bacterium]
MNRRSLPLFALLALTVGCGDACDPDAPTFQDSVKEAYAPCNGELLKAKAGLKAMQLVFKPCGSNNFQNFQWNPAGVTLYYRTLQGPWVLKDTGENLPLRIGMPNTPPAWFNDSLLAVPDSTGRKMSVYNIESHILNLLELDQVDPEQLSKGAEDDEMLYLASESPGGLKYAWRLSANTGESERAFGWLDEGLESMTYRVEQDIVCYRLYGDTEVVCANGTTGDRIKAFKDRTRVTVSVDGRYAMAEGLGAEVSVFREGHELEVSELPRGVETKVRPPSLWITDLKTGEELAYEGVHGHTFQWYDSAPYFASFMLWGFDGEQLNANVALVDMRHFMKANDWSPPLAMDGQPIDPTAEPDRTTSLGEEPN